MSFYKNPPYEKFVCSDPLEFEAPVSSDSPSTSSKPTFIPSSEPTFTPLEITIQADSNGHCIDISDSDISDNTIPLILAICSSRNSQKWIIMHDGYIQSSVNGRKCIQVLQQNYKNNYPLVIQDCVDDNDGQKWEMTDEGTIKSLENTNYCLFENGLDGILIVRLCDNLGDQKWSYISQSNEPSIQPSSSPLSMTPSEAPSSSLMPSSEPSTSISWLPSSSMEPSLRPSISYLPSSEPTWSSTISNSPTVSPTDNIDLIGVDQHGRRYFPKVPVIANRSYSYQHIPNCTSIPKTPGCVSIPGSRSVFLHPPHWAGKVHTTPPSCDKRKKYCDQGIPMSLQTYSSTETLKPINRVDGMHSVDLPGGEMETRSIVAADVNGDGMVDIIIGDRNQNNKILVNNGDGTYSDPIDLPGGEMDTRSIVAADMNGDGMLDIIVGNDGQNNQLLLNNGNGSYSQAIDLPGGVMNTWSIAVADVNGDGMVDIIVGNDWDQNNKILVNNGDGSYSHPIDLPGGAMDTDSVAAADVNGDGMVDIIVGNWFGNNQVLVNNGDGSYFEAIDLTGGATNTPSIAAADMNGDGMVDIIVGNFDQNNQLLVNNGNGGYFEAIDLPGGAMRTYSVAAADVNGDGMVDIIVGNYGYPDAQSNQLLVNNGDGTYSEAVDLPGGEQTKTESIVAADIDGDGMVDIIVGNNDGQNNQLLVNNGDGSYSDEAIDLPGGGMNTTSIAAADVNGDGMVDIIVGNKDQNNQVLVNNGDGSYSEAIDLPGGDIETYSITAADVNGDGMVDIIVGNEQDQNNQLLVNNGDGSYSEKAIDLVPGGAIITFSVAVADVNGDGWVDIIVGNRWQNNQLLVNNGNGTFSEAIDLPGGDLQTYSMSGVNSRLA